MEKFVLKLFTFAIISMCCVHVALQEDINEKYLGAVKVETEYGKVVGMRIKKELSELKGDTVSEIVDKFYGIPYAKPPLGNLRFRPPEAPDKWEEEREAIEKSASCPQLDFNGDAHQPYKRQSEDCLYLNVFSPFHDSDSKFPVILYIHGGSYESGSGHVYDGTVLSSLGVVVVTFNYRLGALGFMLSGDDHLPGNYGLKDQLMVMNWVKRNIASFRGDPDNVMLVGHSVGAALVGIHMTIDATKGLFHSAVAHSGSASASYSIYHDHMGINFKEYVFHVSAILGCGHDGEGNKDPAGIVYEGSLYHKRMEKVVECMRGLDYKSFDSMRQDFPLFDKLGVEFRPYLDGHLIKHTMHEALMAGLFHRVPFITGVVEREFDFFMEESLNETESDIVLETYLYNSFDQDKRIVDLLRFNYINWPKTLGIEDKSYAQTQFEGGAFSPLYRNNLSEGTIYYKNGEMLSDYNMLIPTLQLADILSAHYSEVYMYFFSVPMSYHTIELSFLFGTPFGADSADERLLVKYDPQAPVDSPLKKLSKTFMRTWASFAKNRKIPATVGGVEWSKYDSKLRRYANFSLSGVAVYSMLAVEKTFLWNELIPNLFPKTSLNALGPGGTLMKSYPSSLKRTTPESMKHPSHILPHLLITLLVLACILVVFLLVIIYRLKKRTRALEELSKPYSTKNATNL